MLDLLILAASNPIEHVVDKPILGGPITMHVVNMVVVAVLLIVTMIAAANAIATGPATQGNERYVTKGRFAQLIEVVVLYLLDNVIRPQLGEKANTFAPYLLTAFFFILFNNLMGLIPLQDIQHLMGIHHPFIGGTATGNIAVTAALAIVTFIIVQVNGIRSLGMGEYLKHYLGGAPTFLAPIMIPVEILGTFIKPFALAIRLFANMTAGHVLLATLLMFCGLGFAKMGAVGGVPITLVSIVASVAIMFLELFVAFLQAFIFMFLSTLFIAALSHHHHDDHAHDGHGHDDHKHAHAH
jgi:F-type H+-transporting ATPase subunit a